MENQIMGYRKLSEEEVLHMNTIKFQADTVGGTIQALADRPDLFDQRWVAIAKTHLQQGFMAAVRAIAQPTTF